MVVKISGAMGELRFDRFAGLNRPPCQIASNCEPGIQCTAGLVLASVRWL
jgi:hypothetical protein